MQVHLSGRDAFRSRRVAGTAAAAFGAVASLVGAAPALAGTFVVNHIGATAAFQALPGEANEVALIAQNKLKLQDKGVAAIAFVEIGSITCALNEPYKWDCPLRSIKSASISLGDGEDRYEDVGTSIPTALKGGTGGKRVITGAGNDQISLHNGWTDRISCGGGTDVVLADASDEVESNCEIVDGAKAGGDSGSNSGTGDSSGSSGSSGPSTDGSTGTGGSASPDGTADPAGGDTDSANDSTPDDGALGAALGLTLPLESIAVPRPRVAVVPIGCEATAVDGCRGDVILELPARSRPARPANRVTAARGRHTRQQRRRAWRLGKQSFVLDAGESVKLPVAIALRGHHSIVSRRRRRSRAILKVVHRDRTGKATGVETRSVTLVLERRKWSRRNRRSR